MGDGMRALKVAAVVMGVLILLGTVGLVVGIVMRRAPPPLPSAATPMALDEPSGSQIVGISVVQDRLAVALHGGGPDRIVLLDARSGAVAGRITLRP